MTNTLWALLGAAIVCLGLLGFQHWEISHLDTQVAAAQAQVNLLVIENGAFAKDAVLQNAAVAKLKALATQQAARADAAIAQAAKTDAADAALAARIAAMPSTGNECKDTFAAIDTYYRGIK